MKVDQGISHGMARKIFEEKIQASKKTSTSINDYKKKQERSKRFLIVRNGPTQNKKRKHRRRNELGRRTIKPNAEFEKLNKYNQQRIINSIIAEKNTKAVYSYWKQGTEIKK
jgi:hypothetical protein